MIFAIAYAALAPLIAVIDAFEAFWSARHDPTWETRWNSLPADERTWLAVMATSRNWMATLTDPEEIKLARGRRRQESRRRLTFDLIGLPVLLAAAALVLVGVLSANPVLLSVLYLFGFIRVTWIYRRERQIKSALEDQRKPAAATAAS